MGIMDKLRSYNRLTTTEATPPIPQPLTPGTLPDGATLQPDNNRSFLQQFILKMFAESHIPVAVLHLVPGFSETWQTLLYGDPYACHTFFADMLYKAEDLLRADEDWDPIAVSRKQEYAEAEARAIERRNRANIDASASGPIDDCGTDGIGQIDVAGRPTETIPEHLQNLTGINHRLEAEVQSSMEHRRSDREQTL